MTYSRSMPSQLGKLMNIPDLPTGSDDLVRDLCYARWARENYVPPEQRGKTWHPLVLRIMQIEDIERGVKQGVASAGIAATMESVPQ